MLEKDFGFKFEGNSPMALSADEIKLLEDEYQKGKLVQAVRRVISKKAGIAWSTGYHTALPVLTTAMGCGAENFTGSFDNTDIAKKFKALMK